jgi:ADP-ribose pyrophosphatase
MNLEETILSRQQAFDGKIFSVDRMEVTLPGGRPALREVVRNPGASAVVAVDERGRVAMVRQYRIAAQSELWELPAGKLDPGEDPLVCAQRELSEETGFTAARWEKLTAMWSSPGFCDEVLHIYLARDLTAADSHPDEGEFLALEMVPFDTLMEQVMAGTLRDAKTIVGLLMARELLK